MNNINSKYNEKAMRENVMHDMYENYELILSEDFKREIEERKAARLKAERLDIKWQPYKQ